MKLIDLLVKELPSRGGWPECKNWKSKFIVQDGSGEIWTFPSQPTFGIRQRWCTENGDGKHVCDTEISSDYISSIVTREQYEAAIEKLSTREQVESPKRFINYPAHSFLEKGVQHMKDRAAQRDSEDGERSMKATVDAFNAMFGHNLTETQGWQFMVLLKMARSRNKFNPDDYEDGAAYTGLAGEAHSHEQK